MRSSSFLSARVLGVSLFVLTLTALQLLPRLGAASNSTTATPATVLGAPQNLAASGRGADVKRLARTRGLLMVRPFNNPVISNAFVGDGSDIGAFEAQAPPALGDYPNTSVPISGNTAVTPSATPTGTTSINVSTSTNFKGTFAASPTTGIVTVTDAHPAGIFTVTVNASGAGGSATGTFTLTVTNGTPCVGTPGFFEASDVRVGTSPESVAIGDFNNDGKQDFATANLDSNKVSIRLGDAAGGFSETTEVSVGVKPCSVAIGDFNNDGNQDFAAANCKSPPSTVSIRLGDGAGGFTGTTEVNVGSGPFSIAIGDFNNDGNQDIATPDFGIFLPSVSIRLGNGGGGFSGTTKVSVGFLPQAIAIGDFNADGKQDFATANNDATVSIRLKDSMGGFSGTEISVGPMPLSIAIGDFNNDGKQDFATANYDSDTVSIRLGNGGGGFSGTTEVSVEENPFSVAIGDFNNDGNQDFAAANGFSATVSIRLGDGAGGFGGTTSVGVTAGPVSVAIGDFNNDGKQDFATANLSDNSVSIRLGQCIASPTPTPTPTPSPSPTPCNLTVDSDGDGLPDCWETSGIDINNDGVRDLQLPGANPSRKDIYVEVDYMETTGHTHRPRTDSLSEVEAAFAASPVDGTAGLAFISFWAKRFLTVN